MMFLSSLMLVLNPILNQYGFDVNYRMIENNLYFHASKIARGHGFNFGYVDLIKDIITDMKDKIESNITISSGDVTSIDKDTTVAYLSGVIENIKPD